ncbi:MAG: 50S ribosomal protein L4 [Planctomycetes bacterium]|nr:50S ribosomal protein L4 [Planctomycetota bacterium]
MIQLPVYDTDGKKVDTLSIDEALLGGEVRPLLLKQAYVMFHANRRQGSARTRGRSEVTGSTRKLYRQKGTGNARVGAARTNIRRGGGVAFAKRKSRTEYHLDMPKKMRRFANRNALLAKLTDEEVRCIADLSFREPRTRDLKALLDKVGIDRSCLIALNRSDRMTALSARNLPHVRTLPIEQLNAFELLNHRYLVVDKRALSSFLDGSVWAGEPKQEAAG